MNTTTSFRSSQRNRPSLSCPSLLPRNQHPHPLHTLRKMEEMNISQRGEWWQNMMYPVRRVWLGVATRLGARKNGLLNLSQDVRACEYEDIQVMWQMLNRSETEFGNSSVKGNKKRHCRKLLRWARCGPYMYRD